MRDVRFTSLAGFGGALTVGAGLVHAAAAGTHQGDTTLVTLFALTAVVQVTLGALLVARPSRLAVAGVMLVNVASVAAWVASRTTGIPFVASLSEVEAVGLQDLTVTLMEVVAAVAAGLSLSLGARFRAAAFSPLWVLAIAPTMVGMTAPHTHGAGHEHTHGEAGVAHDHTAGAHTHTALVGLAADPIFAGADTSLATDDQLRNAAGLIVATRDAVRTRFPNEASVIAAGYTSIGDGLLFSSFEHYVNAGYLNDGHELDPDHIESIVVESTPTGRWVASAMYILEPGRTMDDVPDLAGALTVWHDHTNICWDASGTRIAGFVKNGACLPAGTLRATPPMLHVWMRDNACGPFAGLEGHGDTSCTHSH